MNDHAPVPERVARFLLRQSVLGLVAYVCAVDDRNGNRVLSLTLFMCAVIWSSWDGLLGWPGRFGKETALAEGVLLYLGAALVAYGSSDSSACRRSAGEIGGSIDLTAVCLP